MRWEMLFADLEAFAEATERADFEAEVADRGRDERAGLHLVDRLQAHRGSDLSFRLVTGERITGRVVDVGLDWALVDDGTSTVVALTAVTGLDGMSRRARPSGPVLARRVRLGVVLRRLSRERGCVILRLLDGDVLTGTIDRVGNDHFDLALHQLDEPRRVSAVLGVRVVPLTGVALVRAVG